MTTDVLTKEELFASLDDTVIQFIDLLLSLDEKEMNTIPYAGSWTAGQLIRHVTKSTAGMSQAMLAPSKLAERDPAQNIPHLKKTFLDFSLKMQSPEFIIPEEKNYSTQQSIEEVKQSFKTLKENANKTELNDIVEGLPFGPTTKLELLHFILYHTQRHLHQMRKICAALKK